MYAVFRSGGKQYIAREGAILQLEKLDVAVGELCAFKEILMVATEDGQNIKVGEPNISGAEIKAEVIEHGRGKKITIIKFRRRKHHQKKQGHRQSFTKVKITNIAS